MEKQYPLVDFFLFFSTGKKTNITKSYGLVAIVK